MIEIHSHVLPAMDDGAADLDMSGRMLAEYADQGVKHVICTPHLEPVHYRSQQDLQSYLEIRQKRLGQLRAYIETESIEIKLDLGAEILLSADCLTVLERYGRMLRMTLAGTDYLLVELPRFMSGGYKLLDRLLFSIQVSGYQPILAHPERAMGQDGMFETLAEWVDQGRLLLQINASSLVYDPRVPPEKQERYSRRKAYVQQLLDAGLVHFIASDAHNDSFRAPQNLLAYKEISKLYSEELAQDLLVNNAAQVLKNRALL